MTCWQLWEARNDARNDKGVLHPDRVAGKIKAYVDNIIQYCYTAKSATRCDSSPTPRWIPPPVGSVCVNVDAALFPNDNRIGWGVIIRDHNGVFKLSCSESIDGLTSPELAEALAIRRALKITSDNGFRDVILASDCLSILQRIWSPVLDRSGHSSRKRGNGRPSLDPDSSSRNQIRKRGAVRYDSVAEMHPRTFGTAPRFRALYA